MNNPYQNFIMNQATQYPYFRPIYQSTYVPQMTHPYNFSQGPYFMFPQFQNQVIQQPQVPKQVQIVIIDSDEEVKAPEQNKPPKVLDLDNLEQQGKIYEYESSVSETRKTRRLRVPQQRYESPPHQKRTYRKRKIYTKVTHEAPQPIKNMRIGKEYQVQVQSKQIVKTRLIRVYQQDQQFQKLTQQLKDINIHSNDEDTARILNAAGKDYSKAAEIIKENQSLVEYYFQTYLQDKNEP